MTQFSEFDLEEAIWDDYKSNNGSSLFKRGLAIQPVMKRQLKIGEYGTADLVGFDADCDSREWNTLVATVYELKKGTIDLDAIIQGFRYTKGMSLLFRIPIEMVRLVIIGSRISIKGNSVYLLDRLINMDVYTVTLDIDGIIFKKEDIDYRLMHGGCVEKTLSFGDYRKMLSHP